MSQNRAAADIDGVIAGLGASGSAADRVVGDIVAVELGRTPSEGRIELAPGSWDLWRLVRGG